MTCILAIETGDGVVMAGDRRTMWGYQYSARTTPKIAEVGPLLIGAAGTARLGNLVHTIEPPVESLTWDTDRWVALDLIPTLREQVSGHQHEKLQENRATTEGALLVAVRGRCYEIASDWAWTRNESGLYAIGSGAQFALGALHVLNGTPPTAALHMAMCAASAYDVGTGGQPIDVFVQGADRG